MTNQFSAANLGKKVDRRMFSKLLLENQLKSGTKPVKGVKPKKLVDGKQERQDIVPLTPIDRERIRKQLANLERKITLRSTPEMVKSTRKDVDKMLIEMTVMPVQKAPRSKNPITKLYQFIAGKYQRKTN